MVSVRMPKTAAPGAAAWALSRAGMRVFPLVPGAWTPAVAAWPRRATGDADQIQQWWTGEYAGFGVGVATGADSGVWVLDIDRKRGVDGYAALRELTLSHEQTSAVLRGAWCVATPSGGAHLYFAWPPDGGIGNSAGQVGPGLDVRGRGGYVRAPGTPGYQVARPDRALRPRPAPAWLAEAAAGASRRARAEAAALRESTAARAALSVAADGAETASRELRRIAASVAGAPVGTRNNALNKAAWKAGLLGAAGAVNAEQAWALLAEASEAAGARDSIEARRRTFDSGWSAGVRDGS